MSEDRDMSAALQIIPTLTGPDNLSLWRSRLHNFLLFHGAVKVILGHESEPYRLDLLPRIAARDGEYASLVPPRAAFAPFAATSETNEDLTPEQRAKWEIWEAKEQRARSTILLTIPPGLAVQLESLWSALEIYQRVLARYPVNTASRRLALDRRLAKLRLPADPTKEQMLAHFDTFVYIHAELSDSGEEVAEQTKCIAFMRCLGDHVTMFNFLMSVDPDRSKNLSWAKTSRLYSLMADALDSIGTGMAEHSAGGASRSRQARRNGKRTGVSLARVM